MRNRKRRGVWIGVAAIAALLAVPADSYAILHWLCPSNWSSWSSPVPTFGAARVSYNPAPICGSCVPQTTLLPATPTGSCCAVTTYRPFWSWLTGRPRYTTTLYCTPQTAYRPASAGLCCPPTTTYMPATVCDPCPPVTSIGTISAGGAACAGCEPATTAAPSYSPAASAPAEGAPRTFKAEEGGRGQGQLKPVPETGTPGGSTRLPRWSPAGPRVAAKAIVKATYRVPQLRPPQTPRSSPPLRQPPAGLNVDGWRAAK